MLRSGVQYANKESYEKLIISYTVLCVRYGLTLKKIRYFPFATLQVFLVY